MADVGGTSRAEIASERSDGEFTPSEMDPSLVESTQSRCQQMAGTSSFCRLLYSEIEEIGWEHLVRSNDDLSFLSFQVLDKKKRLHILEIHLDSSYPKFPPSIAADVPYIFDVNWSTNSRLKDVIQLFQKHLEKLYQFWDVMETIDKSLSVVESQRYSHAISCRQIKIGYDCYMMFYIDAKNPTSLPECHFLGMNPLVESLRKRWRRNSKKWLKDKPFTENLELILENRLPAVADDEHENKELAECGICYARSLPGDFGVRSGSTSDYKCENTSCGKAFHSICLRDWLQSITTTRRSYDVLFGNCPYCSEPVAVKLSTAD